MSNLLKVDKDLLDMCKTGEYSKVKGCISNTYQYPTTTDKKVYNKLVKLAMKVLKEEDLNCYFAGYLVDKIDNAWQEPVSKSLNFEDLSIELMKVLANYNYEVK